MNKILFTLRKATTSRILTGLLLLCLSASSVLGQVQTPKYVTTTVNSKAYYEYLPKGYNTNDTTKYPLLVFIHGLGDLGDGSPSALPLVKRVGPPKEIDLGTFPDSFYVNNKWFKFIVISPQFVYYPVVTDVQDVLNYLVRNYKVDLNRIYLTGLSMGGGVTWEYAGNQASYANRLAGIVPIAALSSPTFSRSRVIANANIAVWATHNNQDPAVPVSYTNDYVAQINTAPAPVPPAIKTIFNSNVHDAWTTTYSPSWRPNGKNIYEWMLQYARNIAASPNQPPVANAGPDLNVVQPATTATLNGSAVDADGTISSRTWSFVSGPVTATINSPGSYTSAVGGLTTTGVYTFRLTAADNAGVSSFDDVRITVNPAGSTNVPPAVNAGTDASITLPLSSTALNGTASDADGTVTSLNWSFISGPATPVISSPGSLSTNATGLNVAGTYTFRLRATDNNAAVGTDDVTVVVNAVPVSGNTRKINVNVYATNAYNNAEWNNWNSNASLTSNAFKYSDGVNSTVSATLSAQTAVSDNGGSYAVTMCPQQVGRDVSYATAPRTNTINGLDDTKLYDIELFASRSNAGQTTRFTINGTNIEIATFNNFTNVAKFSNIAPAGGRIVITLTNILYYNYLNGFTITEKTILTNQKPVVNAGNPQTLVLPSASATLTGTATDADGTIASYLWSQVSGPAATINSPGTASTSVTGLNTAGVRTFRLTATDNQGATGFSDVSITTNGSGNQLPVANAGTTQSIKLPVSTVSLTGSATDADGTVSSYMWTQVSGSSATIVSPATASTAITGLTTPGTRVFRLTATDNAGGTGTSDVSVIVNVANTVPTVSAGTSKTITIPVTTTTLNGTASDADGSIVSYAWDQIAGPASTISTPAAANTTVSGLTSTGQRVYRLTVTDNDGATASSNVTITVEAPNLNAPAITAGNAQSVSISSVSLSSVTTSVTPVAGTRWTKLSVPGQTLQSITVIGSSTAAGTGVHIPDSSFVNRLKAYYKAEGIIDTIYNFAVGGTWVLDAPLNAALNKGSKVMLVNYPTNLYNQSNFAVTMAKYQEIKDSCDKRNIEFYCTGTQPRPSYDAPTRAYLVVLNDSLRQRFGDRFIDFLTPVLNTADNTTLPQFDYGDGTHINTTGHERYFQIVKAKNMFANIAVSPSVIATPAMNNTGVTALTNGVHKFQVSVVDANGFAASAVTKITVNIPGNQLPVVVAGNDQSIQLPGSDVTLSGSATDADGTVVTYVWSQLSGTAASITSPSSQVTTVTGLGTAGVRVFRLTATDNQGGSSTDDVSITVTPANQLPVVNAGGNKTVTLPANTTTLDGSATDADGSVVSYAWSQLTGPNATITAASSAITGITFNGGAGDYTFRLTATDNQGAAGSGDVTVTVNVAGNVAPVANAGSNKTIRLPVSQATLDGTGTDSDGSIVSYTWSQLSGASATISSPSSASTTITGLGSAGDRSFRLTVMDDRGATASADVSVTVLPANLVPIANAGGNKSITLPVSTVALTGTGSDADGTIVSYAWSQLSGPGAVITSPSLAATTISSLTTTGVRSFRLTVTDNLGAMATSDVTVTVNAAPNQAPVANAGGNKSITLPVSTITLNGSGTDADGTVAGYAWTQTAGTTAVLANASSQNVTISGLSSAGTRTFRLTVTDNLGLTGTSDVVVTVNPAAVPGVTKVINVNLYGTATYVNAAWNNWNVLSGLTSPVLKYSDGTTSTITSVLSGQAGYSDNGGTYAVTMCPQQVGRDASYGTSVRTNTLNGLDNTKTYDLQLFASRGNAGQTTRFTINGVSKDVVTHNNFTNIVTFTGLVPVDGRIVMTLTNLQYYNYLNGFTLTEKPGAAAATATIITGRTDGLAVTIPDEADELKPAPLAVFPNPVSDKFVLRISDPYTGNLRIEILGQDGITRKEMSVVKSAASQDLNMSFAGLTQGIYYIRVSHGKETSTIQVFRK